MKKLLYIVLAAILYAVCFDSYSAILPAQEWGRKKGNNINVATKIEPPRIRVRCYAPNGGFRVDGGDIIILEQGQTEKVLVRNTGSVLSLWSCGWPDGCRWLSYKVLPGQWWKIVELNPPPRIGMEMEGVYIRCDAPNGGFTVDGGRMIILERGQEKQVKVKGEGSTISLWSCGWPEGGRWISYRVFSGQRWKIVETDQPPCIVMRRIPGEAELVDGDKDGILDFIEDDLARRFAPEVRLPPGNVDWTRPASVDWYLARVTMRYDRSGWFDSEILKLGQVTQANIYRQSISTGGQTIYSSQNRKEFFLQPPNDSVHSGSPPGDWRVYVHVMRYSGGGYAVQYWFFYPYNDFVSWFNHEGDWEHITVITNKEGNKLRRAYYAQHEGGKWYNKNTLLIVDGTHPIVYSADGSHASYPRAGQWSGPVGYSDYCYDNGPRWKTWENFINVGERRKTLNGQTFILYGGRWGEVGYTKWTSGPQGPAFKDAWDIKY